MKQRIRLTEQDLHKLIKESVKRVLKEEDDDFDWWNYEEPDMGDEEKFMWTVIVGDDETTSEQTFDNIDDAERDCNQYLKSINFKKLAKKYNMVNGEYEKEYVVALIDSVNEQNQPIDTFLKNVGFGWMD